MKIMCSLQVGDQRYPCHFSASESPALGGETSFHRKVWLPAKNGWGLSIIWGSLTYSSNHHAMTREAFTEEPDTVEVALFGPDAEMVESDVLAYVTAEQLQRLIALVESAPVDWEPKLSTVRTMIE